MYIIVIALDYVVIAKSPKGDAAIPEETTELLQASWDCFVTLAQFLAGDVFFFRN
jgi:hypothetical protein